MPYQNNNRPTINVNTKFFTSYSDNSLMTVSAWNANLSIKFHPLKSISPNGQKIYAQDINETIIVPISPESAHSIRDGIENIILPAIENNEEDKVIFMLGSENIKKCFSILTEKNETGTVDVYVTVSYNISEDFVDNTETVLRHKLSTRRYKRGSEIKEVQTDLLRILDKVKNIDNLSQTIGHGITYTNKLKDYARSLRESNNYQHQSQNYQAEELIVPTDGSIEEYMPFN